MIENPLINVFVFSIEQSWVFHALVVFIDNISLYNITENIAIVQ